MTIKKKNCVSIPEYMLSCIMDLVIEKPGGNEVQEKNPDSNFRLFWYGYFFLKNRKYDCLSEIFPSPYCCKFMKAKGDSSRVSDWRGVRCVVVLQRGLV
jgi:hypothetical protein